MGFMGSIISHQKNNNKLMDETMREREKHSFKFKK
jgi:hypothetical protein